MPPSPPSARSASVEWIVEAVSAFGAAVTARTQTGVGEPEEQLRGPVETLLGQVGAALGLDVFPVGETPLVELSSRPDYGLFVDGVVVGYLELKAPGKGAVPQAYRGPDRRQWERLRALPNLAYTDGNNWAVYRFGEPVGRVVSCQGDVRSAGASLRVDVQAFKALMSDFLLWAPTPPRTARGLADSIAGLCRLLRDEVTATLAVEARAPAGSRRPFTELAEDWRDLLFPGASDERFADSYAQTITFALLLARAEGADLTSADLNHIGQTLGARHSLLGRALQVLTDDATLKQVLISLTALTRVIAAVDWSRLEERSGDPWRYFYEHFLAVYDPRLREDAGAYYTPADVVDTQVRLVDELLKVRLGCRLGFADPEVVTLDPAMGTGAYLIDVIDRGAKTAVELGAGLVDSAVRDMARRLVGFELMTGPYAVAEVLVRSALRRHGADEGLRLHLTDTLADPWVEEGRLGGVYEPIARSRRDANEIKKHTPVLVCLGNPPYDRHRSSERTGGWVRWGDQARGERPIFDDFRSADRDVNLYAVNLYNLYVYFWRWALWKVFEAHPEQPRGVVSFITAASFTDGPGFAEMRAHMRRVADEIWVVDLSPEGHQPDVPTRVFTGVQVPVCITILVRYGDPRPDEPAEVHTITFGGLREEKFERLQGLSLDDTGWQRCGREWRDPFTARSGADWQACPTLLELLPWHSPGVKTERTWVIGPQAEILRARWRRLAAAPVSERGELLKTNRNRTIDSTPRPLPGYGDLATPMPPLGQDERADTATPGGAVRIPLLRPAMDPGRSPAHVPGPARPVVGRRAHAAVPRHPARQPGDRRTRSGRVGPHPRHASLSGIVRWCGPATLAGRPRANPERRARAARAPRHHLRGPGHARAVPRLPRRGRRPSRLHPPVRARAAHARAAGPSERVKMRCTVAGGGGRPRMLPTSAASSARLNRASSTCSRCQLRSSSARAVRRGCWGWSSSLR
jgi:hypothetical protein